MWWWNGPWKVNIFLTAFLVLLFHRSHRLVVEALASSPVQKSTSTSALTALWIRKIQSQPTNTTNALLIVEDILRNSSMVALEDQEKPVLEALRVCCNANRPDLAENIYQHFLTSDTCRTMTISVLGSCDQLDQALQILHPKGEGQESNKDHVPNIGSYHAAIAACGKAKDWQRALEVYHWAVAKGIATTLTTNTILTVLGQRRQGAVAWQVLTEMATPPDRLTYQHAVSAMSKSGMVEEAFDIVQTVIMMQQQEQEQQSSPKHSEIIITDRTFEALMAGYSKVSNWEGVKRVQLLRDPNFQPPNLSEQDIHRWTGLVRVGKGKEAYWELATIDLPNSQILVGVHPNRNAIANGIQLLFYEQQPDNKEEDLQDTVDEKNNNNDHHQHPKSNRRKLGYLLMQNAEHQSCLLGMFLQGTIRGQGLSKVCMAFWFWLCLQANVTPTTGIINKPLLALLLEDKFGMVPSGKGGVEMELTADPQEPGTVLLYAPNRKDLRGVFSPWDQQHQNLRLLKRPPETRGRMITVGTTFGVAENYRDDLDHRVQQILPTSTIHCQLATKEDFGRLFFCRDDTSSSPSS